MVFLPTHKPTLKKPKELFFANAENNNKNNRWKEKEIVRDVNINGMYAKIVEQLVAEIKTVANTNGET
ncbi:hypothetical protein BFP78_00080 [Gaetbulibacter sp. 5U11]|nr:hypothetical protein BFP78_00080 [Gaetbulibacter sp. 5U11]